MATVPRIPRVSYVSPVTRVPRVRRISPSDPPLEPLEESDVKDVEAGSSQAVVPESVENPALVIPIPQGINQGLHSAKSATLIQILGVPRDHMDQECRPVTNDPLLSLVETRNVGPFRVTGVKPALDSLQSVFAQVKASLPTVYVSLGTTGMLCARLKRNNSGICNHAWGTAIDIKINGMRDALGSTADGGVTLAGLAAIAPIFRAEGWYWGVEFGNFEDGMHFEVAEETIRLWQEKGLFGDGVKARGAAPPALSQGDEGAEVRSLQEALAARGYDLRNDGQFGPLTRAAVLDFQAAHGLTADGIAGSETLKALNLG
ncbi:peptidoglycan-binding protein [Rhodospirillum sp. A1_3_36]|uniref:peptidoglycan-binding protein n=1 Tax=Rhodospirillum sp. A1_3_36 TaxID=3391666 RepID=UPI0039A456CF